MIFPLKPSSFFCLCACGATSSGHAGQGPYPGRRELEQQWHGGPQRFLTSATATCILEDERSRQWVNALPT